MKNENKTTLHNKNMPYRLTQPSSNPTPVGHKSQANAMYLQGATTMPVSAGRRTSGGLIVFPSHPITHLHTRLPAPLRSLRLKPYAQALDALRLHQAQLRRAERDPTLHMSLAWITTSGSSSQLNCRALESFELSLAHTLFLESAQPQQSVEAICSEGHFDAIVLEASSTPALLKRAHRWLRPAQHNPLVPEPANRLAQHPRERVFILIDEPWAHS